VDSLPRRGYLRFGLQTLDILAASPESARALIDVLSDFDAELSHTSDGSYSVTVRIDGDHAETIAVLGALERYVTERARAARLSPNGHEYVMHPDPAG
jgi:hypothetical protein